MRYIMIDPYLKTVSDGEEKKFDVKGDSSRSFLNAAYNMIGCHTIEMYDMQIKPKHVITFDGEGLLKTPQAPAFIIGNMHVIGRAIILGSRGADCKSATISVDRVANAVHFGVPARAVEQPTVKGFATIEELQAYITSQPQKRWL